MPVTAKYFFGFSHFLSSLWKFLCTVIFKNFKIHVHVHPALNKNKLNVHMLIRIFFHILKVKIKKSWRNIFAFFSLA